MTKRYSLALFGLTIFLLLAVAPVRGQEPRPGPDIETLKKTAPRIFIDCGSCDIDYIKTEVTFVNYVRDRKEAHAIGHIILESDKGTIWADKAFYNFDTKRGDVRNGPFFRFQSRTSLLQRLI